MIKVIDKISIRKKSLLNIIPSEKIFFKTKYKTTKKDIGIVYNFNNGKNKRSIKINN
tara:strand:+ start:384 stop:554 length:171 start_codon:yes stop_codon:yes gene_type:complete